MSEEEIQRGIAITTAEYNKLKAKADRLDELLVIYKRHYGNVIEYAIELQEKAELVDTLEDEITRRQEDTRLALKLQERIEAFREFVLIRRDDIEKDMENFGMLKPVLDYFLEEAYG